MIVNSIKEMLKESLSEMIHVAEYCYETKKDNGGCYGYPCSILLFSVLDTIGSFYKGKDYSITIDGKDKKIKNTVQHFYILNSKDFYNQNLTEEEIKIIYDNYRSTLTHNSSMPPKYAIEMGDIKDNLFTISDREWPVLNLTKFLHLSKISVDNFIQNIEKIVPNSIQENNLVNKEFKK